MALARLKSVAGVTIPDTSLCNAAVDLLESSSPGFLCTHCLRTYIFGSLAVRGLGRSVVDEEAAFCGAVLHDLGLVPPYRRDNRFEVDGRGCCSPVLLKASGGARARRSGLEGDRLAHLSGDRNSVGRRGSIGPPRRRARGFWACGFVYAAAAGGHSSA